MHRISVSEKVIKHRIHLRIGPTRHRASIDVVAGNSRCTGNPAQSCRVCDLGGGRKVYPCDVASADGHILTGRVECVSSVAWSDGVDPIRQASECVTAGTASRCRCAGRSAECHRRSTPARRQADRSGNVVGLCRRRPCVARGLEVSLRYILQNLLLQR